MRKIVMQKQWDKDMKKVIHNPAYNKEKLREQLDILQNGGTLPANCKDHKLAAGSRYDGYRDFHHANDICVIYLLTKANLILYRIGSHAELKLMHEELERID